MGVKGDLREQALRGLIPKDQESRTHFLMRADSSEHRLPSNRVEKEALDRLESLFGIRPDWPKVSYEGGGIRFWEGAYILSEGGIVQSIVVHPRFLKRGGFLGYRASEVVAHELIHAVRAPLGESKFEEHLAYMTSRSALQRTLGPLFEKPSESLAFLLLALIAALASFWTLLLLATFIGSLFALFVRLFLRRLQLKKALQELLQKGAGAHRILLFLKDSEIIELGHHKLEAFLARLRASPELRHQQILELLE